MKHPASSISIQKINVVLVLKNRNLRSEDILSCLRPSVTLTCPDGRCRTIVMKDWRTNQGWFSEVRDAVQFFSKDKAHEVHDAARILWQKIKRTVRAEAQRKSTKERYSSARRRMLRNIFLDDARTALKSLSRGKEAAKYIQPSDMAKVWKSLMDERSVQSVMDA